MEDFDSLRREATKLERHLEDRVSRYQQVCLILGYWYYYVLAWYYLSFHFQIFQIVLHLVSCVYLLTFLFHNIGAVGSKTQQSRQLP